MRKAQNKREMEKRDLADVVEQEKLIEMKGELKTIHNLHGRATLNLIYVALQGRKAHKLMDVHIRPALDNKRIAPGELEIHQNGLRYYAQNGAKVGMSFYTQLVLLTWSAY